MSAPSRHLYVGAVALLIRVWNRLPFESKLDFEDDGDPMQRLAGDFNGVAVGLEMQRNGTHDWMVCERQEPRP